MTLPDNYAESQAEARADLRLEKSRIVAPKGWNLDSVLKYIQETGNADVEEDNFGNICVYPKLYEDSEGRLREGNATEVDDNE